jgi:bifunctional DNase/RNase
VLVEVKVERLTLDRATKTPVVVLREENGERILPIWIGSGEASAIQMHMVGVSVERPLTHDLLVSTIRELGAVLKRVSITGVEQNTYFARLELSTDDRELTLDARPSDSIAVALRIGSPIYADDSLLEVIQGQVSDSDEPSVSQPPSAAGPAARVPTREEGMTASELREHLRKLDPEDFGRFNP